MNMSEIIDFGVYNSVKWDDLSTEYLHGLADMGNTKAEQKLEEIYNLPIQKQKIGFGKFLGKQWIDLDTDYLYWILNNVENTNIKFTLAKKALQYREKKTQNEDFENIIYVD